MKVNKYKVLATLVRSFFDAFSSGIIDSTVGDKADTPADRHTPKAVKQMMLDHYEHIAPVFMDTMFFPLAAMNYEYADIERVVREAQQRGDDMMALVRTACGTDDMYEGMVTEYKRNFGNLLSGRMASNADHLEAYTRGNDAEAVLATERAVELTVRVVMFAYARGLRQNAKGKVQLRQATLFRLMLDAMNVLLNDEAVSVDDADASDLGSLFLKVCHTQQIFTTMTDEMDRTYDELVRREGVEQ